MRHVIPISGKDSLATALIQKRRQPDLSYEYLYNPTGMELPEVNGWLSRVEAFLGQPIHRVGDDLQEIIHQQKILPSIQARYCTRLAKIYPMEDWLSGEPATVYFGIRADEKRQGYHPSSSKILITPVYPLIEECYTLPMVWLLVGELELLPPAFFWQSMYDLVAEKLGASLLDDFLSGMAPWERQVLFAWRSRPNCFQCFQQRLYEWVGLLEHHPDLFWQAAALEQELGAEGFTIMEGWPLPKIAERAEAIKRKRAKKIIRLIADRAQMTFVEDEQDEEAPDLLSVVSCGLFCGK